MTENFNSTSDFDEEEDSQSFLDKLRLASSSSELADIQNPGNSKDEDLSEGKGADASAEEGRQIPVMPSKARRAVINLMRQGVILSSNKNKLFETICFHQEEIRRYLEQIYLSLVLDEKAGIAFIASYQNEFIASEGDEIDAEPESISLINRRTLSLFDSLLLLVLRKHFRDRENAGEQRVIIDLDRVDSYLTPFLPLTNNSKSDRKKLNAAIQRMLSQKVLSTVKGSEDRFEITPIIRYVVNAEFLESMLKEYTEIATGLQDKTVSKPSPQVDNLDTVKKGF